MKAIVQGIAISALSAAFLAVPAARAQDDEGERTKVIAVQYKLFDNSNRQRGDTVGVGDSATVRVGETVRIELVGTAIIEGIGEEIPIEADFDVAAGRGNIELGQAGDNWVTVTVRNDSGDGVAQVGFAVTGDYEMRGGNTSGRITLEIEGNNGSGDSDDEGSGTTSASALTSALYRGILNQRPGAGADEDIQSIREDGYGGAVEVANALAGEAERQGLGRSQRSRGYEAEDMRRAGGLYRSLLKREASDQEMWNEDRGFVENVRALHQRGLASLVDTIVRSQEFRQAWGFVGRRSN